jgi:hypothetical protein
MSPLIPVACPLNTVFEEGVDETLGDHGLLVYILRVLGGVSLRRLFIIQRGTLSGP